VWAREESREAYVSAEHAEACQEPRVSPQDVDTGRTGHFALAPAQGSAASFGMSPGVMTSPPVGRISDRATFAGLRRPAKRARCGPVTISWVQGRASDRPRAAYAVGRRVGGAVERNLLRRRLRAIFGEMGSVVPAGSYLVSVEPQAARTSFADLRTAVLCAMEAVGTDEPR
jgi:ribonuclease P protein component